MNFDKHRTPAHWRRRGRRWPCGMRSLNLPEPRAGGTDEEAGGPLKMSSSLYGDWAWVWIRAGPAECPILSELNREGK